MGGPPIGKALLFARGEPMGGLRQIDGEQFWHGVFDREGLTGREPLLAAQGLGSCVKLSRLRFAVEAAEVLHAAVH